MHISILIAVYLTAVSVAAIPFTLSTSTSVPGTSFDGDTPPESHMVNGYKAGVAVAALVAGAGIVGAWCYCCRRRQMTRKPRSREYRMRLPFPEEEINENQLQIQMPRTPPPSYEKPTRQEDVELEFASIQGAVVAFC
ncbi:hypothetical protein VE03_10709 [Pseudogymnoascus sp. 23342-1-I1]|nr:hypothetical protein VE03_10709 [Pseudogymnoascus sp. 23342-1-I1]